MATIGHDQNAPPFRKGVSQTRLRRAGVRLPFVVSLRNGRRIFIGKVEEGIPTQQLIFPAQIAGLKIFVEDTRMANIIALERVIAKMVGTFIPTVALKTGRLRNAMIGFIHNIRRSNIHRFESFGDVRGAQSILISKLVIDFQALFAQLDYAVFHSIEFRKKDFYVDPHTPGTQPYSTTIFNVIFTLSMIKEVNLILSTMGWDISSEGLIQTMQKSLAHLGRLA